MICIKVFTWTTDGCNIASRPRSDVDIRNQIPLAASRASWLLPQLPVDRPSCIPFRSGRGLDSHLGL